MAINTIPEYKMLTDRSLRQRRRELAVQQRMLHGIERRVVPLIRRVIEEDVARAAEAFAADGEGVLPFAMRGHQANIERVLVTVWKSSADRFGQRIFAASQKAWWGLEFKYAGDTFRRRVDDWIATYGGEKIVNITNTTMKQVRSAIQQGESQGFNVNETAKLIVEQTGGTIAKARSRVIARTEVHNAAVAAGDFAAESLNEDLDLELVREWISAEDLRRRPSHARADGQRRDMQTPFDVGGYKLKRPGDPDAPAKETIQCRCVVGYVTPEDRDDEQIIEPFHTQPGGLGNLTSTPEQELRPVEGWQEATVPSQANIFSKNALGVEDPKWRKVDMHIANYANETLMDLKNQGMAMPKRIKADSKIFTEMNGGKNDIFTTSFYSPEDDTIYLNPRSAFFRDKGKNIDKAFNAMEKGRWTTGLDKRDVMVHELAHREHIQVVGDKKFNDLFNSNPSLQTAWEGRESIIREKVSRYAATNPKEFVAEVYTGLRRGEAYDESVLDFYREFGGPKIDGGVVPPKPKPKPPVIEKPVVVPPKPIAEKPEPNKPIRTQTTGVHLNEEEYQRKKVEWRHRAQKVAISRSRRAEIEQATRDIVELGKSEFRDLVGVDIDEVFLKTKKRLNNEDSVLSDEQERRMNEFFFGDQKTTEGKERYIADVNTQSHLVLKDQNKVARLTREFATIVDDELLGKQHSVYVSYTGDDRSFMRGRNDLRLSKSHWTWSDTVLGHEMMHGLDEADGIRATVLARSWIRRRGGQHGEEKPTWIGGRYEEDEKAYHDHQRNKYIGKWYSYSASEVYSMGIESLTRVRRRISAGHTTSSSLARTVRSANPRGNQWQADMEHMLLTRARLRGHLNETDNEEDGGF